ncbi:dimethylhistidine N-methyltransferase [Kordiimonas sediminis]|uniref:Dimethylhistidine N-methyltransferase n=1 Tax=Kordiimonas sediminis TaxID=1735581 RepID=A0A919AYL5_9PROT|nr:L-histidine N(alpha)-methyltransferase [Kordiimonas sediminis]GHF31282.1 dimethylhistidine N-methyltransferase [Kordiimonas sediminis]
MNELVTINTELLISAAHDLSASVKTLNSKWFYDTEGSELFEAITELDEYYQSRTERSILENHTCALSRHIAPQSALIELGSGASVKTRILLDALKNVTQYLPVDIAADFLRQTAQSLHSDYPGVDIHPIVADFTVPFPLPSIIEDTPKTAFFPGSTIGNLSNTAAASLLQRVRSWRNIQSFFIGIDLIKSTDILLPAYDDAQGVTAQFNLNILRRLNKETGADFDLSSFQHKARWNKERSRIEMHLVSTVEQTANIGGYRVNFSRGESIHTENCRKYSYESFSQIAENTGWQISDFLTDSDSLFAVVVLTPQ